MDNIKEVKNFNDLLNIDLKRELDRALFLTLFTDMAEEDGSNETKAVFSFDQVVYVQIGTTRLTTTVGRYIFNKFVMPDVLFNTDYINEPMNKNVFKQVPAILSKAKNLKLIDTEEIASTVDRLTWLASAVSTIQGGGLQADSLFISDEAEAKIQTIRDGLSVDMPEAKLKAADLECVNILKKELAGTDLHEIVASGAKGSYENNMKSTFGYRGILEGRMIKGNLTDISPEEYVTVNGLRGSYGRSKLTAIGGYLSKLIQAGLSHTFIDVKKLDCGTELSLKTTLKNPKDFLFRYVRKHRDKGAFVMLTENNLKEYKNVECDVRSTMYCKSRSGFCVKCFGESFKVNGIIRNLSALGTIVSADMMQKQMKSFHDLSIKYGVFNFTTIFKGNK